jgi:hypothetical protein
LLRALAPLGIPFPRGLDGPVGYAGSRRFNHLVTRSLEDGDLDRALELSRLLETLGIEIDRRPSSRLAGSHLADLLDDLLDTPESGAVGSFVRLLRAVREARLQVDEADLQDRMTERLDAVLQRLLDPGRVGGAAVDTARALIEVAGLLNLNTEKYDDLGNGA